MIDREVERILMSCLQKIHNLDFCVFVHLLGDPLKMIHSKKVPKYETEKRQTTPQNEV